MRQFADSLIATWTWLETIPKEFIYGFMMFVVGFAVLGFMALMAGLATYFERKIAGHIQSRMGPMRVGPHGILQFIADGIKLFLKEDLTPAAADRKLFKLAPYVLLAGTIPVFVVIPFAVIPIATAEKNVTETTPTQMLIIADLNIGVLYVIAISSLVVVGIVMGGWASGNKWSLLGAMRSAAQIVSYEVPAALCILAIIMLVGSMSMSDVVRAQEGGIHNWFVFRYPPFGMILFLIYFISALAEVNRTPFDIPEAESELVAGYHTEYSGFRFALFFLGEYMNMFALSMIAATLFLGGWQGIYPVDISWLPWWIRTLISFGWLMGKTVFLVFVMMWLRWTLPRLRVDQLMYLSWKVLVPAGFVCVIGIGIWMAVV